MSDVVEPLGAAAAWTVNHPGNAVLQVLASRVLDHLGQPGEVVRDPGRALLGGVRAPLEEQVLRARGLVEEPREHWLVDGVVVTDEEVRQAQTAWYADHPGVVAAGLERHGETMGRLGLL